MFRFVFEVTWIVGSCALILTEYIQFSNNNILAPAHEFYVDIFILVIFIVGLLGARWRFFQNKNVKMYCITLGATIFLISLCLFDFGIISKEEQVLVTYIYPIFALAVLVKK